MSPLTNVHEGKKYLIEKAMKSILHDDAWLLQLVGPPRMRFGVLNWILCGSYENSLEAFEQMSYGCALCQAVFQKRRLPGEDYAYAVEEACENLSLECIPLLQYWHTTHLFLIHGYCLYPGIWSFCFVRCFCFIIFGAEAPRLQTPVRLLICINLAGAEEAMEISSSSP